MLGLLVDEGVVEDTVAVGNTLSIITVPEPVVEKLEKALADRTPLTGPFKIRVVPAKAPATTWPVDSMAMAP